ncbi:uncharacterized protein LODBEIA_P42450 [Lodderomyces beijingensis]|uniref:Rho-GAP domain-containing protein n=1 Tax=Lodderomyces beijingensis TaxID=1775926 RepID=A0ABP0ZST5_9ASCO
MSDSFANNFWTADFITGLNQLQSQSTTSISQLHEFRKLVFSLLKYYHSNSEYLTQTSTELNSPNGPFRSNKSDAERLTLDLCFKSFIDQMGVEAIILMNLAADIDKHVLDDLTQYLKYHESKIRREFDRLETIYGDYLDLSEKISKTKKKYFEQVRLQEYAESSRESGHIEANDSARMKEEVKDDEKGDEEEWEEEEEEEEENYSSDGESYAGEEEENDPSIASQSGPDKSFKFPLRVGPVVFEKVDELQKTLARLISKVPTSKRSITLPGYKADIFSSDSLCEILVKSPVSGLVPPSRSNLEKFGQALVDLKLITPTSIFSKKFKSEGVWFEWSDLASDIATAKTQLAPPAATPARLSGITPTSTPSSENKFLKRNKMASPAEKLKSDIAETTARFNSMFSSVKSSIMKTNHAELIRSLLEQYNKQILELEDCVYYLERGLIDISQYLEKFENKKLEIIYDSSAKLSQILSRSFQQQSGEVTRYAKAVIDFNTKANITSDFKKTLDSHKSGLYFPVSLPQKEREAIGNLPQDLKSQFDLFNDVQLQVLNSHLTPEETSMAKSSVPVLLDSMLLELKSRDLARVKSSWLQPLDFQMQWRLKQELTQLIGSNIQDTSDTNAHISESPLMYVVVENLRAKEPEEIVAFLKCWLLEMRDSTIPFLNYETITAAYSGASEQKDRSSELVMHLSTVPRSNLASLICIIEHICLAFGLASLENHVEEEEKEEAAAAAAEDDNKLASISKELNSMEAIGAVPFMHLLMRPSTTKHATGFKPPLETYEAVLIDLLSTRIRRELLNILVKRELEIKEKKEHEKKAALSSRKKISHQEVPRTADNSVLYDDVSELYADPDSPSPQKMAHRHTANANASTSMNQNVDIKAPRHLSADAFELRPFKTRSTPLPSPQSSPKPLKESTFDIHKATTPSSAAFLAPKMDIQFEGK